MDKTTWEKINGFFFMSICLCPSDVTFRLCYLQSSVHNICCNDITKNQSESLKSYRIQSLTAFILNMATMGDVDCGDVEVSVDIGELLSAIAQIELLDEPGADCEHVLFQFS